MHIPHFPDMRDSEVNITQGFRCFTTEALQSIDSIDLFAFLELFESEVCRIESNCSADPSDITEHITKIAENILKQVAALKWY